MRTRAHTHAHEEMHTSAFFGNIRVAVSEGTLVGWGSEVQETCSLHFVLVCAF